MSAMPRLPGYRIVVSLYESPQTLVYRGIRECDRQPVVIKVPRHAFPSIHELVQFRNEYTIACNLNHPNILKSLALEPYQNGYALVMEDFQGISLKEQLKQAGPWGNTPQRLTAFFQIALQVVEALAELHHQRVIHKDLKPSNILIHPDTRQVKLADFSLASLLPRETQEIQAAHALEGTLAYLAPEQTGRMNRGIDYRSDFYALGVTFYQLLTGQLPFVSDDPMELIHCHLAKHPVPPHEVGASGSIIPAVLSDIVLKLMAKNAEDRYQSALGIRHDLEECLAQWQENLRIVPFQLGRRDVSDRFLIPETLYGRAQEVQTLLDAFARVASLPEHPPPDQSQTPNPPSPIPSPKSELVLVTGFSGIGKTAVVNEVHKPITRQHGYFIKGKFDQFNRNIPFSGVVQALRDLMRQLLSESDAQLQVWKAQMLAALGESGQVMIDVIPELEQVIGPQPAAVELSGMAAQNRFNLLFQKFIQVFATPAHPLVLFLDDLQWADSASLNLMHQVMTELDTSNLLLIGAYRNNEVSPAHPLMLAIAAIAQAGATVSTITLQPLTPADLNHLVADTLHCPEAVAHPLTKLVVQKTQGNPFFVTQFLRALHQDGLITFDWQAGHWQCDMARVQDAALTDDVVEFMALQLQKLPPPTQAILKLAACIGNQFDLTTLAIVSEQSEVEAATRLWTALQQGFILPQSQIYKFFQQQAGSSRWEAGSPRETIADFSRQDSGTCAYRFLHDRVQQAAYSLIPDDQKQTTHYHIGQLLLQQTSAAEREERIFELVNQLNWGTALMTDQADRDELAHLNLIAARRAKAATAYQAGRDYAALGLSLLGAAAWQRQYGLTLALHELAAESASLCGDFAAMEQWIDAVIEQANTLLETIPVYRTRILASVYQNKLTEAIAIGQQTLQRLGVQFPETPTPTDIHQQIQAIAELIGDRTIEELVQLPLMTDPTHLAITQIASSLLGTAYLSGSPLYPLLVMLGVRLSIQSGNTLASPVSYAFYGAILCNLLQDVETGVQFGQLALNIVSALEAKVAKPEVIGAVVAFILHRKHHLRDLLPIAKEGYTTGLEVGSLEYAGYNAILFCVKAFNCGQPLATLEPEVRAYSNGMVQLHQLTAANYCWIIWQSILNLLGRSDHPTRLSGEALQEAEFLPSLLSANDPGKLFQFYLYKAMLCFLFEDIAAAMTQITAARQYLSGAVGLVGEPTLYYYDSLIAIAHWEQSQDDSGDNLAAVLQRVAENQAQLQQAWAQYAPMNYQHKVDLVTAEHYRVLGKHYEAADWYDRAIARARENGYIQDAALGNELAARFYLQWGRDKVAAGYLQDAYYDYARWGAKAKTDDLENRYPQLLGPLFQAQHHHVILSHTNRQTAKTAAAFDQPSQTSLSSQASQSSRYLSAATLDFASVLKASQALSSEIHLDQLVAKLLQVVMENAGAKKAALLIAQDDSLAIEAVATLSDAGSTLFSVPLAISEGIPLSLVNYVKHSLKTVVLDDATAQTEFTADPYLLSHQPRSVLCTPILNQGKFIGLLYLENPLTVAAFTRDRLEVIHLLCTQAAISLENARLYRNLQASEARYQRLAENVPGVIYQFRLSPEGQQHLSYISPRCIEMFEVEPELILADAQAILGMVHPDDSVKFEQSILASAQTLQSWQWVGRIRLPSGRVKWIQGGSRPERQSDGAIVWDGILMDVSDRKQAESDILLLNQALEQQNQNLEALVEQRTAELMRRTVQLEASNRELEFFSYSVSHDLRAPLRHINGFVSALQQQLQNHHALSDPKVDHYVQVIQNSSQKMALLIDSLLDLSRIGRKPMQYQPVNLRQLVDEAIASLQHNPDLETTAEFVIGELPTVQGDARLLQQVLNNLVSNAVKFSRNHPTPHIEIGSLPAGVIFIRDNGAGFDMQYADKLFGPFQRLHTATEFEGTGIGLAIVQRIIHRHGGKVWAESQPNQGATFYFTLGGSAHP